MEISLAFAAFIKLDRVKFHIEHRSFRMMVVVPAGRRFYVLFGNSYLVKNKFFANCCSFPVGTKTCENLVSLARRANFPLIYKYV